MPIEIFCLFLTNGIIIETVDKNLKLALTKKGRFIRNSWAIVTIGVACFFFYQTLHAIIKITIIKLVLRPVTYIVFKRGSSKYFIVSAFVIMKFICYQQV